MFASDVNPCNVIVLSRRITSQRNKPHHITAKHITSHHSKASHHTTPHHPTTQHDTTSHHSISHRITPPHIHIASHHITSQYITSHQITPHHVTSHHTSQHITSKRNTSHHTASHHITADTTHHTAPHHIISLHRTPGKVRAKKSEDLKTRPGQTLLICKAPVFYCHENCFCLLVGGRQNTNWIAQAIQTKPCPLARWQFLNSLDVWSAWQKQKPPNKRTFLGQ